MKAYPTGRLFVFLLNRKAKSIFQEADPEPAGRIKFSVRVTSPPSQIFFNNKLG